MLPPSCSSIQPKVVPALPQVLVLALDPSGAVWLARLARAWEEAVAAGQAGEKHHLTPSLAGVRAWAQRAGLRMPGSVHL